MSVSTHTGYPHSSPVLVPEQQLNGTLSLIPTVYVNLQAGLYRAVDSDRHHRT